MHAQVLGCLEDLAALMQSLGLVEDAVRLNGAVETFRERLALPRPPRSKKRWDSSIAAARAILGGASYDEVWADGRTWELDGAVRRAQTKVSTQAVTA